METIFKFQRLRDVKIPSRSFDAAGWDFYVPDNWDIIAPGVGKRSPLEPEWESKTIGPNESLLIPSGLRIRLWPGWALKFENKSGNAMRGLVVGATLVDPDYQGEIHLHVWNVSKEQLTIKQGDKLLQAMFIQVNNVALHETTGQLFPEPSARAGNGFGSTGRIH